MMNHEVSGGSLERVVTRCDPDSSLQRSYVLSLAHYQRLVADGCDPEMIAEAELSRVAMRFLNFDERGRVIMIVDRSRMRDTCVTVYAMDGEAKDESE